MHLPIEVAVPIGVAMAGAIGVLWKVLLNRDKAHVTRMENKQREHDDALKAQRSDLLAQLAAKDEEIKRLNDARLGDTRETAEIMRQGQERYIEALTKVTAAMETSTGSINKLAAELTQQRSG